MELSSAAKLVANCLLSKVGRAVRRMTRELSRQLRRLFLLRGNNQIISEYTAHVALGAKDAILYAGSRRKDERVTDHKRECGK